MICWVDTPHGAAAFRWNCYAIIDADGDESYSAEELAAAYPSVALGICDACGASDGYRLAVADAIARAAGTEPTLAVRALTDDEAARVARLVPLLAALCEVSPENVRVTVSVDRDGDSWLVQTRHGGEWRRARVPERNTITDGDDDMLSTVENRVARWAVELLRTARSEAASAKAAHGRLLARANAIDAGIEKAKGSVLMYRLPDGSYIGMVAIPAGEFTRGCDTSQWIEETPEARITMSAYLIARYPTTVAQFRSFVTATNYVTTAETERSEQTWRNPGFEQADDHPVVCVSHDDATAFCAWAGLALPTEAQWEYAARGTDGRTYPWGEDAPDDARLWWSGATRRNGTCSVGEHPAGASPFGVHDLAGNVWEWVADWYDDRGYDPTQTTDPTGREHDAKRATRRAMRGGSSDVQHSGLVRAALREKGAATRWFENVGFRASCSLSERSVQR